VEGLEVFQEAAYDSAAERGNVCLDKVGMMVVSVSVLLGEVIGLKLKGWVILWGFHLGIRSFSVHNGVNFFS